MRRNAPALAVVVLVAAGAAGSISAAGPKSYEATAVVAMQGNAAAGNPEAQPTTERELSRPVKH